MSKTQAASERPSPPRIPRWVKIFGLIIIILILLFGVLHLTGNSLGGHLSHGMATMVAP